MKTKFLFICIFSAFVFFVGCDNSSKTIVAEQEQKESDFDLNDEDSLLDVELDVDVENEESEADEIEQDSFTDEDVIPSLQCKDFKEGMNEGFMVDNGTGTKISRSFILTLPKNIESRKDWPIIFSWHGVGDTAPKFLSVLSGYVDNETMPFILITPEDANYSVEKMPPDGVDWDNVVLDDGSAEAQLFDAVSKCLDEKWGIDKTRIYSTGFSAGAITSDSLGVLRGDKIASILTFSGAYLSDSKNIDDMNDGLPVDISSYFTWPEMNVKNKYTQVLIHGKDGPKGCDNSQCDSWSFEISPGVLFAINFNHMSLNDADYLTSLGHDVILCDHENGHDITGIPMNSVIKFFKDHPLGTVDSPYKTNMPQAFKDICEFKEKTK